MQLSRCFYYFYTYFAVLTQHFVMRFSTSLHLTKVLPALTSRVINLNFFIPSPTLIHPYLRPHIILYVSSSYLHTRT